MLITYSGHGYADRAGNFYLFPYDIGENVGGTVSESLLQQTISSAELSLWLRDVDAGELVMVVDACHSAASVESPEFKPGPMGARGLGQLAYDKGMRILASTRAGDLAWESGTTQQGLLSYALVKNGLQDGEADFQPKDGSIGVREWLQYAVDRVPQLYAEALQHKGGASLVAFDGREARNVEEDDPEVTPMNPQQPALFDFRRSEDDTRLAAR